MEDKLVEYIAKNLVDDPSRVTVSRRETSSAVIVQLKVASGDMGRVIGKSGRVANAIRALLRVPVKGDKRAILEID
ncbi:MAG: KH domain-containing protein [Anaerolineae bacterium]|nr:KH domain-containing protein [Anaerolineae bacterium]